MLTIDRTIVEGIIAHARREHPIEACGVVAGPTGSHRPVRHIELRNAARSQDYYQIDPLDLLRLYQQLDERGESPIVIYHSHTDAEAYPSSTDINLALEPEAHYVVVSTRCAETADFRSFKIVGGRVIEDEIVIVGD